MNELLYKKIDNCIRDKMHKLNDKIRKEGSKQEDPELTLMLCMLTIGLCADISQGIKDILEELVLEEMQYAFKLSVPLDVSYGFGTNWMEIK